MQCYVKTYTRNAKGRNLGCHLNLLGNNSNVDPLVECLSKWRHVQERNIMPNSALTPLLTYFLQTYVGVWVLNANKQSNGLTASFVPSSLLECLHYNPKWWFPNQ